MYPCGLMLLLVKLNFEKCVKRLTIYHNNKEKVKT